jgi:hypothetical protein
VAVRSFPPMLACHARGRGLKSCKPLLHSNERRLLDRVYDSAEVALGLASGLAATALQVLTVPDQVRPACSAGPRVTIRCRTRATPNRSDSCCLLQSMLVCGTSPIWHGTQACSSGRPERCDRMHA